MRSRATSARRASARRPRRCRSTTAASSARATSSRARRSSSSPRRPASCGPGGTGGIDDTGTLVLTAMSDMDPVTLSVLSSALSGIAEEMGALLIRASYSSNIKERRDCSAALFDADGRMVAQAEHIPVHLGAMPEAVEAVRERDPQPGDVFMLNDPFRGGTHLPDITLVSPLDVEGEVIGFAVTRAHHSDVGGMSPGSMPAGSTSTTRRGSCCRPCGSSARARSSTTSSTSCWPTSAPRTSGAATCGRSSPRTRAPRSAWTSSWSAAAATRVLGGLRRGPALRRAPRARGDRRAARRHVRGEDGARGRRRDGRTTCRSPSRSRSTATQLVIDFDGTAPAVRRQRQLPARRDPLGLLLRAAGAARRRRPGQRRRLRAGARPGARGVARRRPQPVGRRRGQRRDEPAPRRHRAARARPGGRRPARAGAGDDEQPRHRRRGLDVLRDDRRRPGRVARRATGTPACTSG